MPSKPTGRPRGRPKGSKNIPKLEAFVAESLVAPTAPPGAPRGPWAGMTAEERSAYSKALNAKRRSRQGPQRHGVPRWMTSAQFDHHQATQEPIIAKVMEKLAERGQLPEHPWAVEAFEVAMKVLRSPVTPRDKIAAARLLLDFALRKPPTTVSRPIATAEGLLAEVTNALG
jgi:hypothetical protein